MKHVVWIVLLVWASFSWAQEMPVLELEKGVSKAQLQLLNDLAARRSAQQAQTVPTILENETSVDAVRQIPPAVQMYLYMSPVDAARLLSAMPEEEAFDIFKQIPSYRAALILARLPADLAKRWTLRLTGKND